MNILFFIGEIKAFVMNKQPMKHDMNMKPNFVTIGYFCFSVCISLRYFLIFLLFLLLLHRLDLSFQECHSLTNKAKNVIQAVNQLTSRLARLEQESREGPEKLEQEWKTKEKKVEI